MCTRTTAILSVFFAFAFFAGAANSQSFRGTIQGSVTDTSGATIPGAKVKVFEGLGHNPFWEDPRSVADVINPFLQS